MSGVHVTKEALDGVWSHSLGDPALRPMLQQYFDLLLSSYGPKGTAVLLQNSAGRETYTSSSSQLIQQLQFSHPCLKFINAIISSQNKTYGLYGSYTGLICAGLLIARLDLESDISSRVVSDIFEWIMESFLDYFSTSANDVAFKIDLANMDQILSVITTILKSKTIYFLTPDEVQHLSIQIAKAFLKTIPDDGDINGFGKVFLTYIDRTSTSVRNDVLDGILYRDPYLSCDSTLKMAEYSGKVKLILFNVLLGYESNDEENVEWTGQGYRNTNYNECLTLKLKKSLQYNNIKVVTNQKVVDVCIKYELSKVGIVVIDRLGTSFTESLIKVSGCKPISNLTNIEDDISSAILGELTDFKQMLISDKTYLLLANDESGDVTLLLPRVDCHAEVLLKESVESCMTSLRSIVQDPRGLPGAGCFEVWIVNAITTLINNNNTKLCTSLDISSTHLSLAGKKFCDLFVKLAVQLGGGRSSSRFDWSFDNLYGHLWGECDDHLPAASDRSDDHLWGECDDHLPAVSDQSDPTNDECSINTKSYFNGTVKSCRDSSELEVSDTNKSKYSYDQIKETKCGCCIIDFTIISKDNGYWSPINNLTRSFYDNLLTETKSIEQIFKEKCNDSSEIILNDHLAGKQHYKIDCFAAKVNALSISFECMSRLLNINYCIYDK